MCRPEFLDDGGGGAAGGGGGGEAEATLELRECRHPCAAAGDGAFIPNDIVLGAADEVRPRHPHPPPPPPPRN